MTFIFYRDDAITGSEWVKMESGIYTGAGTDDEVVISCSFTPKIVFMAGYTSNEVMSMFGIPGIGGYSTNIESYYSSTTSDVYPLRLNLSGNNIGIFTNKWQKYTVNKYNVIYSYIILG